MAAPVVTASVLTSRIVSSPFIGPRQDLAARVHDTAVVSAMRRIPDHIGEPLTSLGRSQSRETLLGMRRRPGRLPTRGASSDRSWLLGACPPSRARVPARGSRRRFGDPRSTRCASSRFPVGSETWGGHDPSFRGGVLGDQRKRPDCDSHAFSGRSVRLADVTSWRASVEGEHDIVDARTLPGGNLVCSDRVASLLAEDDDLLARGHAGDPDRSSVVCSSETPLTGARRPRTSMTACSPARAAR